jgi:hypothetical protein
MQAERGKSNASVSAWNRASPRDLKRNQTVKDVFPVARSKPQGAPAHMPRRVCMVCSQAPPDLTGLEWDVTLD